MLMKKFSVFKFSALNLMGDFLNQRKQKIHANGKQCDWIELARSATQGASLGSFRVHFHCKRFETVLTANPILFSMQINVYYSRMTLIRLRIWLLFQRKLLVSGISLAFINSI